MERQTNWLLFLMCVWMSYDVQVPRTKLDPKSQKCIFLGYADNVKGYRLCNLCMIWSKRQDANTRDLIPSLLLISLGYNRHNLDHCTHYNGFEDNDFIILLLYVNDMLVVGPNKDQIQELKAQLAKEFDMKDLRLANKILGMQINWDRKDRKVWLF